MYLLGGINDIGTMWGSLLVVIIVVDSEGGMGLRNFQSIVICNHNTLKMFQISSFKSHLWMYYYILIHEQAVSLI